MNYIPICYVLLSSLNLPLFVLKVAQKPAGILLHHAPWTNRNITCCVKHSSVVLAAVSLENRLGSYGDLYRVRDVTKSRRVFGLLLTQTTENWGTAPF